MADSPTKQWVANEDGFLSIGEPTLSVIYHPSLNTILVTTKDSGVVVLDVTSGCKLQKSDLSACHPDLIKCHYLCGRDKLFVSDGIAVGVRKDLNGILLLDTALQTPVRKADDIVKLEFPLQDASHLFKGLMSNDLPGVDYVEDVIKELEKQIQAVQQQTKGSHKLAKWATISLQMPHGILKNVFNILMMELNNMPLHTPDLPVAAAIYDRLTYLLPGSRPDLTEVGSGPVDRSQMYSEAARAETFSKWPHMSYKWALPEPMGQAGFYHQPNGTGDDRAMCFTCSVCLVCWEPTDEPWSEHERHSPICPFVKGEYTQNVPLSVSYATEPAMLHGKNSDKIECVSTTSSEEFIATSTTNGNVVIWDVTKQLKKHLVFNIDPYDPLIAEKTGTPLAVYDDTYMKQPPKTAWNSQNQRNTSQDTRDIAHTRNPSNSSSPLTEVMEIPLRSEDSIKQCKRNRPSRDIQVTSLCVAGADTSCSPTASCLCNPALISGVSIRRCTNTSESKEVQLMNKVNEALNTESDVINSDGGVNVNDCEGHTSPYLPYLLIHGIAGSTSNKEVTCKPGLSQSKKGSVSLSDIIQMVDIDYDSDCDMTSVDVSPLEKGPTSLMPTAMGKEKVMKHDSYSKSCDISSALLNCYTQCTLQCIEVPSVCRKAEYIISSITPTLDKVHIILVITPRYLRDTMLSVGSSTLPEASTSSSCSSGVCISENGESDMTCEASADFSDYFNSESSVDGVNGFNSCSANKRPRLSDGFVSDCDINGGYFLVYKLDFEGDAVKVCEEPVRMFSIENAENAIKSMLLLPLDALSTPEEEESRLGSLDKNTTCEIPGMVAVITNAGKVIVHKLDDYSRMVEIDCTSQLDHFKSATFCTGMDRLCLCTENGSLYFYQLAQKGKDEVTATTSEQGSPIKFDSTAPSVAIDQLSDTTFDDATLSSSLLVKQPISVETLAQIHELTTFENMLPRFSATVPQCWNEIQQEQQQRRHPQHLQQQGEATQHTRTWRLQSDNNSWDEHLFELVLPRPACVGHIDVRFTLHPLVMSPQKIQVTLLKQNITNIGRQPPKSTCMDQQDLSDMNAKEGDGKTTTNGTSSKKQASRHNPVLDNSFLQKYNAEILCGPVDVGNYMDLSGSGGLITLTSSSLMKVKTKSFLIHMKALLSDKDLKMKTTLPPEPVAREKGKLPASDKPKKKISLFDQFHLTSQTTGSQMTTTLPKVSPDTLKGCDCITEISITVRKSHRTSIPKDRLQRAMILAQPSFHEQLVLAVFNHNETSPASMEQKQNLALDILCWIASVQINEPKNSLKDNCVIFSVLTHLKDLIRSCFLEANRTSAHKCSRLIAICMEYCKNVEDLDLAPNFNLNLLEALLQCLPLLVTAKSAGALHWYFTLLNRVKCMDINVVGTQCVDLLMQIAHQYSAKTPPIYNLLKARYGLYGTPCDPELFDTEPPPSMKVTNFGAPSQSYASVVNNNNNGSTNSGGSSYINLLTNSQAEDTDFQDLLALTNTEKPKNNNQNMSTVTDVLNSCRMVGLLEVEPLHFTCHATSEGTRMERVDNGLLSMFHNTHPSVQGGVNFGEGLASTVPSAAGVALASLSTAMASAEQQLHLLQNKQQQLMKLQTKLGPGDKSLKNSLLYTLAQKAKLEQKLAESSQPTSHQLQYGFGSSSGLFPPTPKTTPLFMTPPMTPPYESYSPITPPNESNNQAELDTPSGKQTGIKYVKATGSNKMEKPSPVPVSVSMSQPQTILQPPPLHVLVVERMHSGARRFVVLDFGKPVLLTDILIPTCVDLASLSIDVWDEGEEIDGRRLIVASDIGLRPLVMNDLTPPPVCRYLKMTTIGRYGASTTRSRIPIGSFFGHTFIFPWEQDCGLLGTQGVEGEASSTPATAAANFSQSIMSHLGVLLSLKEDIHCRYSLARHRLESHLSGLDQTVNQLPQYSLGNKQLKDHKVIQAYNDCTQLQLQLNLAQQAVSRLQTAIGIQGLHDINVDIDRSMRTASLDKLRVISEFLLETLLSMTGSTSAIPSLTASVFKVFDQQVCQSLFQNLCINGTKQMQLMAGMLLVRMCGRQVWWGDFLGNTMIDLFGSHQMRIIPQERVFILLTTLGQKSLMSSNASQVLESLMALLAKLLTPLTGQEFGNNQVWQSTLDLQLISRLLVFLTKTLDLTLGNADDTEKKAESLSNNNHWDFLLGESAIQNNKPNAKSSTKMYRRKLHKRLMHHKQQLLDLQQAKKIFFNSQKEKIGTAVSKEWEAMMKQQENLFKKQLRQYSSKNFKDIMNIGRTDAEILRKIPKDYSGLSANGDIKDVSDMEGDTSIVLPREKCIPVVRGLVALLLSMDFTCSTDLFLITCKVLARIVSTTRPAIMLSEAMTQDQLEQFVMLCSSIEHSHTGSAWGGPWAVHSITCLLLDILDSEKMYPFVVMNDGITDDEMTASLSETDDSHGNSGEGSPVENIQSGGETSQSEEKEKESTFLMNILLHEDMVTGLPASAKKSIVDALQGSNVVKLFSDSSINTQVEKNNSPQAKLDHRLKVARLKKSLADYAMMNKFMAGTRSQQGTSIAMDSRLEFGIELSAELRLKMMMSLEADNLQNALLSSLPNLPDGLDNISFLTSSSVTDDDQLMDSSHENSGMMNGSSSSENVSSSVMLSTCFNHLVMQLPMHRVDLDTILSLWLTMNDDNSSEDIHFDCSKVPQISLSAVAVSSLLHTLTILPSISVRTWTLAFQTLTWLTNIRCSEASELPLASVILADSSLVPVLIKFLSGSSLSSQNSQVGPTTTQVFQSFLVRLSARCANDNETHLRELLLRLVYTLTAERGPFQCGLGPLDAQYRLIEHVLEHDFECVDINNAISVISSISMLTKQHLLSQERVSCNSSLENSVNPKSCFGGLFASMLCPGDARMMQGEATRDVLVCSLLKLVNSLVQVALPHRSSRTQEFAAMLTNPTELTMTESMTDAGKISQSLSADRGAQNSHSDDLLETDEQKSENNAGSRKSCSHFVDTRNPTDKKEPCIADIILTHEHIMSDLIHSLNRCNSNTMASLMGTSSLGCNAQQACQDLDPVSVGDCIFQVLSTLNRTATDLKLIIQPLFNYLTNQNARMQTGCHLSEPLLWILVGVLDCNVALETFIEMGGVEVMCNNLVWSSKQLISSTPSFISGIMPYLSAVKPSQNKQSSTDESSDGLINFAPQSSISSSNPSAGPADVLVQPFLPHRRARSAAWSYHFFPDAAWVDLHIQLSCAILLKEVHVRPHLTSLVTCPSSISLEISRDGISFIPVSPPQVTSGLALIKLQLQKPEVASIVTLRLHKPRDSNTLGLSQIMVLGSTAFGDNSSGKTSNGISIDEIAKTSMCWLRLLHHCLQQPTAQCNMVAERASPITSLLNTCSAMLVSSIANTYSAHLETVLLKLGLQSTETGLALIDNLLRNPSSEAGNTMLPLYGKVNGVANEATVDILYQLGMTQDSGTATRIQCLMTWLGDNARKALQRSASVGNNLNSRMSSSGYLDEGLPNPSPSHVHCIATILWQSQELPVTYNLQGIITQDLFSSVYEWSTVLKNATIKQAVDCVIASMCHIQPYYLSLLLEWMGINISHDSAAISDDIKEHDSAQLEAMTDDSKEASSHMSSDTPIVIDTGTTLLNDCHLKTLAMASQSEAGIHQLLSSGFPELLCQSLLEFCTSQLDYMSDSLASASTDTAKTESVNRKPRSVSVSSLSSEKGKMVTVDLVAPVLNFLAEVASEPMMKDWLVSEPANIFWPVLLSLLCSSHLNPTTCTSPLYTSQKLLSGHQRAVVETATVTFFISVTAGHSVAQHCFAQALSDVVKEQGITQPGSAFVYNNLPLSGFTRRLFLQVLLEDEKIQLAFSSAVPLHKGPPGSYKIYHPKFGAGHKHQVMTVGFNTTCGDVVHMAADNATLRMKSDSKDDDKDEKKDVSELGIEVVDQISQATGIVQSGVAAKEKRDLYKSGNTPTLPRPPTRRGRPREDFFAPISSSLSLHHALMPGQALPVDMTLSQVLVLLHERGLPHGQSSLQFMIKPVLKSVSNSSVNCAAAASDNDQGNTEDENSIPELILMETPSFPSALHVFASIGGLALLAEHLPLLYPEITRQVSPTDGNKDVNVLGVKDDWVTVEYEADIIFEMDIEPSNPGTSSQQNRQSSPNLPSIPPHSLVAFGLFLRLPGYAEVLLTERKKAQCLLRLVLGVTDDGDGGHILTSPVASTLPTLPFSVLKSLFDQSNLTTDDGVLLRRMTLDIGAIHLIFACLSVLSHHAPRVPIPGFHHEIIMAAMQVSHTPTVAVENKPDEKSQHYWAKGTGFGTGSFTSSWDAEQALLRQKSEEEHVTCLLQVLASYINPGGEVPESFETESSATDGHTEKHCLPAVLPELLTQSCLIPAISSYLRNDSVLDMARHVPLYKALLELLRGIAICPVLVPLLMPIDSKDGGNDSSSLGSLLSKMKSCVDTYASRLKTNSRNKSTQTKEDDESEGLALLIPDIQRSALLVEAATKKLREDALGQSELDCKMNHSNCVFSNDKSLDELYICVMKELQFDTCEMLNEDDGVYRFKCPHHYESNIKAAGEINNAARARRLAQEAVTLSTSLPLSASSSVFVRCDEDRLDVMKVLITGPSETPYANGCFEFDVYFPQDYPTSPPLVNLETTGNHAVRFNPNLYNDGKVCLSILNTWHGRPEEKWNSQTSSFLQVLVSIQSLILVSEPYFNEPGYERSRGTLSGTASSREYDANIRQATVKWAMLEVLRSPSPFKDVITRHFWLKRHEITRQCEEWIADLEQHTSDKRFGRTINHSCLALKRHFNQLKEELAKMKAPPDLEDYDVDFDNIPLAGNSCSDAAPDVVLDDCSIPTIPGVSAANQSLHIPFVNNEGLLDHSKPLQNHIDHDEDDDDLAEISNWTELPPPILPPPISGQSLDASNDDSPTSSELSDSSTATPKMPVTSHGYMMNSNVPDVVPVNAIPVSNDIGYDEVDFC